MKLSALVSALVAAGLMVACGGGGGDAPAPTTSGLTLSGVVAQGAALAGASVTAKCATGTGTATAGSTGNYTFTITGGALPCVLEAVSSDNSLKLHSVATGTGSTITSNITPVTELLVAQLVGAQPDSFFADSTTVAALASTVTESKVTAAQTAVVQTLQAAGVDTSSITNMVSQTLVPAAGTSAGNGYDQMLDALKSKLTTAGTTLATLATTVAQSAATSAANSSSSGSSGSTSTSSGSTSSSTATAASNAVSLPADLLLKPKASNCDALRSTTYRIIRMAPSNTSNGTVTSVVTVSLNAPTLTFTDTSTNNTWTWPNSSTNCRYTSADGTEIVVAPSGIIVARSMINADDDAIGSTARNSFRMVIGIPVQNIALADLAGKWNGLAWNNQGAAGFEASAGTFELGADGTMARALCFDDALFAAESACSTKTTLLPRLSAHSAGGFTLASTNPADLWADRAFAFRAGNGDLSIVSISAGGEVFFGTKYRTLSLPAVGETTSNWNVTASAQNVAAASLGATRHVILTVDSATGATTRATTTEGTTDTHSQTVTRNAPRPGYTRRTGATGVMAADGSSKTVREFISLPLRGTGLTAVGLPSTSTGTAPSNASLVLSVTK